MKRFLFALFGTAAGLVALLSFKTQSPIANAGPLPAQSLTSPSSSSSAAAAPPNPSTSSSASSSSKASSSSAATARAFTGGAVQTRYGVVQVKVTVEGSKITNVAFVQLTAFDPHSQQINSSAGPQLLQETLSAQSANVDTISGATYTSDGYKQSLQSALDQAGLK